ncbi:MAG: NTP/NDP exchange transporter [Candidatus Chromulinivorax sp.]
MVSSIIRFFYPDIKKEEVFKFSLFAITLFFILGAYWALRLLKDLLIYKLAFPTVFGWDADYGRRLIPTLKTITPFLVAGIVVIYTKLLDMFEKHKLFYIFCSFYSALFGITAVALYISSTFGVEYVGMMPMAVLGVSVYLATESFGSLVIALFWSFAVSCNRTDEAKRAFPFMIAVAQIGTIGGSSLLLTGLPSWILFAVCSFAVAFVMVTINNIVTKIPANQLVSDKVEKKQKPDMLAGVRLLFTKPYLLGVFVVSTFYEIAKSIVDYQMKSQASIIEGIDFESFLGWFGFWTNVSAFVMALLGTSMLMKRYGLRVCVLLYPVSFAISLVALYAYYQTGPNPTDLLWATFYVMMFVTAVSYAVNNPTKEMMYIPTSSDAKFKVKGITDTIGSRGSKLAGANIAGALNIKGNPAASVANLMAFGTLIGLGIIGLWLAAAIYVGTKNAQLTRDNEIIE